MEPPHRAAEPVFRRNGNWARELALWVKRWPGVADHLDLAPRSLHRKVERENGLLKVVS